MFQETAMRVWRGLAGRVKLRNPRGWVMTIGYRVFLDTLRRRSPCTNLEDQADHRLGPPGELAERSEDCDRVQAAIAELPDPIRQVIVLHYVGGLTLSETAAAMEIPEGTAKGRLNAALKKLRSVLE